jgi:hypothetical protein
MGRRIRVFALTQRVPFCAHVPVRHESADPHSLQQRLRNPLSCLQKLADSSTIPMCGLPGTLVASSTPVR